MFVQSLSNELKLILRLHLNIKSNVFPKIILEVENRRFRTVESFDAYLCFLIILSAANLPVMMHVGVPAGLYAHWPT